MTRRAIVVITLGAGALLVVLGSLFPLYGVDTEVRPGPGRPSPADVTRLVALTGWEYLEEPTPLNRPEGAEFDHPVYGYGLVFAAVLAGIGALLQLRTPLLAAIGRFGVLAGFGLAIGTLWAALETLRSLFGVNTMPVSFVTQETFVGTGAWLIGLGALALLVGAVMAHDWPARVPRPTGVAVYQVDDDDTPPFGIAIPVSELDVPPAGPAGPVAPPVAELPPVVELPGAARSSADERRHPTGGNPSTVD
ncbi:hypothetical protein B0I31_110295 [Saccharothrix carnea]|uniref:Uncharacterized protein n=1 Tax=Saccharothrix carnea TaxID=1280637 RepID=A0A2P8I410_SACCR|nr:hypothetical protein [Saccharothrix carnea]PSL53202.1 hypothetical protein B0I31_110295 [Saccharothrix carnea]